MNDGQDATTTARPRLEGIGRVDVPDDIRNAVGPLSSKAARVASLLSGRWSTEPSFAESEDLVLLIAEEALAIHRLMKERRVKLERATQSEGAA